MWQVVKYWMEKYMEVPNSYFSKPQVPSAIRMKTQGINQVNTSTNKVFNPKRKHKNEMFLQCVTTLLSLRNYLSLPEIVCIGLK